MTEENGQQIDATVEHVVPDPLAVAYRKALEALQGAWERRQPDSGLLASDDYMAAQAALGMLETLLTTRADVSADITALADGTPEAGREIIPKIRTVLNQAQALNAVQKHNPNPTPRRWILDRWLPAGRTVLFAGPGGKGKSRLALQLAVNIVTNGHRQWVASDTLAQGAPERMATPHFGAEAARTSPPVAVYASWEDEASEIDRRLACLGASEAVEDRLHFIDLAGRGALWEPMQTGSRYTSTLGALAHVGDLLRAYCEQVKARLLVVDPLAAAYACNENDRGLVRSFMASWDRWARDNECAVVFVAHPPKSEYLYSGSTDWLGAARTVWRLDHERENSKNHDSHAKLALTCEKANYGLPPQRVWLQIDDHGVVSQAQMPEWAQHDDDYAIPESLV